MSKLKIVATIVVKAEFQEELVKVFETLVDETRREAGNISYSLHQDTKDPLKYIILESWRSHPDIEEHNDSPHFRAFVKAIDGKIDSLNVDIIKKIY